MKLPWNNLFYPPPAPPGFGAGKVLPEQDASWLSRLTFHWLSAFLDVGFSRPLEKEDFWELPASRHASVLTDTMERNFYVRCPPEKRPLFMRDIATEKDASATAIVTDVAIGTKEKVEYVAYPQETPGRAPIYDESLFKALYQSFKRRIWASGILLLVSDTLRTTSPLVNREFITWLTESYVYFRLTEDEQALAAAEGIPKPRGIGYGIGLAFAIYIMQESASIMANHFTLASMTTGLYGRSSVIGNIFRKSLRLSGRSKVEHSVGQITTMISTDAARIDSIGYLGHYLWESPIQLAIAIGLLIGTIGYSALVGLAVLIVGMPVQFVLVTIMYNQRKKCVNITDRRVRLTTEVLQGIRLIKSYGWEAFYAYHITNLREQEIARIRISSIAGALLIATFYFLPVIASVIAFITYGLTGHELSVAKVFTALQLFNVMRVPLLLFPLVLSSLADAIVSFTRICNFLTAEEIKDTYIIDPSQPLALHVDGDFEWEVPLKVLATTEDADTNELAKLRKEQEQKKAEKKAEKQRKKEAKLSIQSKRREGDKTGYSDQDQRALPSTSNDVSSEKGDTEDDQPFALKDLHLDVQKGAFVAIVGRVGSGKSSILQALIGEMRRTRGEVVFNDRIAYFPQSPWIKNSSMRENILFGQPYDEKRFDEAIYACGLQHDLEVLPHGEHTEIGEKGMNLSGGQKARISLARAAYSLSGIVLLDDPLSAVDAHVGKHVMENCFLNGPLADRTRILVTHSLHILGKTDYIYVMDNGMIVEEGTYNDLCSSGAAFSRLIEEHGHADSGKSVNSNDSPQELQIRKKDTDVADALMQEEERNVGAVTWDVYKKYLQNAGGLIWAPVIAILLIVVEGNNAFTTLFLGFWSGQTLRNFSQGEYMAVYGALGAALAISTFLLTYTFMMAGLVASLNLYRAALTGVLNSRISFFDTTPMGRILSRLSKDQDSIDTLLPHTFMQFLTTFFSVLGTVALVFYTFPYLGIIFLPLGVLYYGASIYYRRSSVETKRLDSLMRSILYGSYSETLTGIPTIRAYGMQPRAIKDAERGLDMENRAYLMTVMMQRWLALRLEFFANALVLGIGLFGAGFRHSVSPAKIGVVMSYTLSATQVFSEMISLFAQCEQNMNAVERILHYVELHPEESDLTPSIELAEPWPANGSISFHDVRMAYRPGLPVVLKGISFDIRAGEKVGIVGRTGSGKSSIIQALLRLVELQDGRIDIDGLDISTVGLHTLRRRIALVPQDTTLFLGTLRDNLDPERLRTDGELITLLQQAWLLPREGPIDPAVEAKFSLDSTVGDEGSNYSAGEKQLLALSRALVKKSRIIILASELLLFDEATSSVDVETDAKIQQTIQTEFANSTLLCIAHRLNTIVHYDRILVMNDGKVAEYDTVLNLFDKSDSIFRSLCNEAQLSRADITKLRSEHASR